MQVHRYGDTVALYTDGSTLYLSRQNARALARALFKTSTEIGMCKFTDSKVGTFNLDYHDARQNEAIARD